MSVQQSDHSSTHKESITFAIVSSVGAAALVLGLALIISANYHERAYIFLILGAGGFMGGLAGMIMGGQKVRAVLDFGLIAMGFVGMVVGFNYLISQYGPEPNSGTRVPCDFVEYYCYSDWCYWRVDRAIQEWLHGHLECCSAGSDRVNRYCNVNRWHGVSGSTGTPHACLCFACIRIGLSCWWNCRRNRCSTEGINHSRIIDISLTPT